MRGPCGRPAMMLGLAAVLGLRSPVSSAASSPAEAAVAGARRGRGPTLSFEELRDAAAKVGMEVLDPEEWEDEWPHAPRRLAFEGTNCVDVEVNNSPDGVCDGIYFGVERENVQTLRGPTLFVDTCFEPQMCGESGELLGLNRRIFLARAYKCEEGKTTGCPKENVWGVYSAITNATTGEDQLGFLRAWANGAIHPVDVTSQWWTFQYTNLDPPEEGESRECTNTDCLLPVDGVTIQCAEGSPNITLPPGMTPYPSPAPTKYGTLSPIPTPSPVAPTSPSEPSGDDDPLEEQGDSSGGAPAIASPRWPVGIRGVGIAGAVAAWVAGTCERVMFE